MQLDFENYYNGEDPEYLSKQLITYIGSKRALLNFIGQGVSFVKERLAKEKLNIFDVFSGSGVTARYFKQYSKKLFVNDLEDYSRVTNRCYLTNRYELDEKILKEIYNDLFLKLSDGYRLKGFISDMYSPVSDTVIEHGERVFYTTSNALYLDTVRQLIDNIDDSYQDYFLAPLLSEASIHANTSGVFKGFYKNKESGIGQFGGNNKDALLRILGNIELKYPVFSKYECEVEIFQGDSNTVVINKSEVDLAYLDPPYNQHPYGSNYFMLNLLVNYTKPENISPVSGIPVDWNRSNFNKKREAYNSFKELVENINAKYLLVSFNSDGYIKLEEMIELLERVGRVQVLETKYNTFRGSRNLKARDIHVKEYLYLVEKR
ncbi:MAG: DNA modification methylase [Spirochaetes bacterium]|nr:MAG: DNA modification methylase [Spirochaetota bacterium]